MIRGGIEIKKKIFCIIVLFLFVVSTFSMVESIQSNVVSLMISTAYEPRIETNGMKNSTGSCLINHRLFSLLEPGDIAFKRPDVFPLFLNHCLLFIGYNESTALYIFIEANSPNNLVQYRYENESTLTGSLYGPFAQVRHANDSQRKNAIDFAQRQLGKQFQYDWINKNYNPEDTENDSFADAWYCSELVWAAYYNCNNPFPEEEPEKGYVYGDGIDLDRNGWNKNFLDIVTVHPLEILFNFFIIKIFFLNNK